MDPRKQLLTTFSALALGVGGFALSAQATVQHSPQRCTTSAEECACEEALKKNTIDALEEFLRKYPPGVNGEGNACTALALAALNGFSNGQQQSTRPERSGGSPYNGG